MIIMAVSVAVSTLVHLLGMVDTGHVALFIGEKVYSYGPYGVNGSSGAVTGQGILQVYDTIGQYVEAQRLLGNSVEVHTLDFSPAEEAATTANLMHAR